MIKGFWGFFILLILTACNRPIAPDTPALTNKPVGIWKIQKSKLDAFKNGTELYLAPDSLGWLIFGQKTLVQGLKWIPRSKAKGIDLYNNENHWKGNFENDSTITFFDASFQLVKLEGKTETVRPLLHGHWQRIPKNREHIGAEELQIEKNGRFKFRLLKETIEGSWQLLADGHLLQLQHPKFPSPLPFFIDPKNLIFFLDAEPWSFRIHAKQE